MHHLNPTGMLHIAGFVTVCEAFLGIDPHVNLFREIFRGRTVRVKRDPAAMPADMISAPVGDFGLQRKPGKSASYLPYTPVDSHRGWHEEWFYIRNPAKREEAFPTFTGKRPEKKESWGWGAPTAEKARTWVIEDVLKERVSQGLNGVHLFATIFFRRVHALALHRSKMWDHAHGESLEQL